MSSAIESVPFELLEIILSDLDLSDILSIRSTSRTHAARTNERLARAVGSHHYIRITPAGLRRLQHMPASLFPLMQSLALEFDNLRPDIVRACCGFRDPHDFHFEWLENGCFYPAERMPGAEQTLRHLKHIDHLILDGNTKDARIPEILRSELPKPHDINQAAIAATKIWHSGYRFASSRIYTFLVAMQRASFTCRELSLNNIAPFVLDIADGNLHIANDYTSNNEAALRRCLRSTGKLNMSILLNVCHHEGQSEGRRGQSVAAFLNCAENITELSLNISIAETPSTSVLEWESDCVTYEENEAEAWTSELEVLFRELHRSRSLQELKLTIMDMCTPLECLGKFLGVQAGLRGLEISLLFSCDDEWKPVVKAMKKMKRLERLDVSALRIYEEDEVSDSDDPADQEPQLDGTARRIRLRGRPEMEASLEQAMKIFQ